MASSKMMIANDELKRMGKQAAMAYCKVVLAFIYRVKKDHEKYTFVVLAGVVKPRICPCQSFGKIKI
jgi:hypothetical protein